MKSQVIDIQRCSVHDGPGIRTTVFMKGCPLRCDWCHNPESQSFKKQVSYNKMLCTGCNKCHAIDEAYAIRIKESSTLAEEELCDTFLDMEKACPKAAMKVIGKDLSVEEVFAIIKKDDVFYEHSGGGMTVSGGEALCHTAFVVELLKQCREQKIHTCIETSGYASKAQIDAVLPYVDLFLYDYKHSDDALHKKFIGVSNVKILENLEYIYSQEKPIILRCPIIPEVNDTKEHFEAIQQLAERYANIQSIELLPYHDFGISKGSTIGIESTRFRMPEEDEKMSWVKFFGDEKIRLS